ncbi:MAG: hypothetical protein E7391_05930 [Ruminococcaceae bacterium]|nr:hypothetical protein [Oscillospiraceae bacterium]
MEKLQKLELKIINGAYNKKADGIYVGDILSYALVKLKKSNVWVTSQINENVVAIAYKKEASCVILTDGLCLNDEAISLAKEHDINVFSSDKSMYDTIVDLYKTFGGKNE